MKNLLKDRDKNFCSISYALKTVIWEKGLEAFLAQLVSASVS